MDDIEPRAEDTEEVRFEDLGSRYDAIELVLVDTEPRVMLQDPESGGNDSPIDVLGDGADLCDASTL